VLAPEPWNENPEIDRPDSAIRILPVWIAG